MTAWVSRDDLNEIIDRYRSDRAVSNEKMQAMNKRIEDLECEIERLRNEKLEDKAQIKMLKDFVTEQFVKITCTARDKEPVEVQLLKSLPEEEGRKIIADKVFAMNVTKPMKEVILWCENALIDFKDLNEGDNLYVEVRRTYY